MSRKTDPLPGLTAAGVFEALAAIAARPPRAAGGGTRKGDRRANWEVSRQVAARHKNRRRRVVREFWQRFRDRPRRDTGKRVKAPNRIRDQIVLAMVPGEWHALCDLLRAIGRTPGATGATLDRMRRDGLLRRHDTLWTLTDAGAVEQGRIAAMVAALEKETAAG